MTETPNLDKAGPDDTAPDSTAPVAPARTGLPDWVWILALSVVLLGVLFVVGTESFAG